ncbi:hypothetical protein NCCP691_39130 [Noviherbaspirillum aridicola]|uniref:Uncharacterized protein n=1 Tax=Noviherbaspirillum aridicola TaxID=2849687 RepID=A0ABQ4QB43_9BURK|nr:hypothetical protein NCCP691_39130 [Noviherbaspirillum aridicola]
MQWLYGRRTNVLHRIPIPCNNRSASIIDGNQPIGRHVCLRQAFTQMLGRNPLGYHVPFTTCKEYGDSHSHDMMAGSFAYN